MFEPIHVSAFGIIGNGIANPIETFWSAMMMLDHFEAKASAARLMKAIGRVTAAFDLHTLDLGSKADAAKVSHAAISAIHAGNA